MSTKMRRSLLLLTPAVIACFGGGRMDLGDYRVSVVDRRVLGFGCQPRYEYYVREAGGSDAPQYLGTCLTPLFVQRQLEVPGEASCHAVSQSGDAMVYMHRPEICGAGDRAARKAGGLYLHDAQGDRLLYDSRQVGQVWSRDVRPGAILVGWSGSSPSRGGAVRGDRLFVYADGHEEIVRDPPPRDER